MTRILIVEDSATQAERLRAVLEEGGYEVVLAYDAESALPKIDSSLDLVISDIMMPGLSGYELCKRIKAGIHGRNLPVMLLSTLGDFQLVNVTATEAEAKLWLAEHPGGWDLAIIDLVLDQGTGMALLPRARATARQGGTIVVFSDYASEGIRKHCLRLGADAVFLKSQTQEFMDYCSEIGGLAAAPAP